MRPEQYWSANALQFQEALEYRTAIERGKEDVRDEVEAAQQTKRMSNGR